MKLLALSFVLLAQFGSCASSLCRLPQQSPAVRLVTRHSDLEDAIVFTDNDAVVVAHRAPFSTYLALTGSEDEVIASIEGYARSDVAQTLVASAGHWWFGRMRTEEHGTSIVFVSDADQSRRDVTVSGSQPLHWIPIDGEAPRGIIVQLRDEQPSLEFAEVTERGVVSLARVAAQEEFARHSGHDSRWSAEALNDRRIVIVAVDTAALGPSLNLWVSGAPPVQATLPCSMADRPISTATDSVKTVVVVGTSAQGRVVAALFDVDRPDTATCVSVSPEAESAAQIDFGSPNVVWTGERFVAAWIRADGTIRAREVSVTRRTPVLTVGDDADTTHPLRTLLRHDRGDLCFAWRTRQGDVLTRHTPSAISEVELGRVVLQSFCEWSRDTSLPEPIRRMLQTTDLLFESIAHKAG